MVESLLKILGVNSQHDGHMINIKLMFLGCLWYRIHGKLGLAWSGSELIEWDRVGRAYKIKSPWEPLCKKGTNLVIIVWPTCFLIV